SAAAHPEVDDPSEFLELPLHGPTDVGAKDEFNRRIGGHCLLEKPGVFLEIRVVANKSNFIAIPRETFVALLVIEEQLEPGSGPTLFTKVPFHFRHDVDELPLVSRLSPPKKRSRPFRVDWKIDERNRTAAAMSS